MSISVRQRKRPKTRRALAPPTFVTQRSSTPLRTTCVAEGSDWEDRGLGGPGQQASWRLFRNPGLKVRQGASATPASPPKKINVRNPAEFARGVMPNGGARSATLERMTALSPTRMARGHISSWAVPAGGQRWTPTSWRCEPAFFCLLFLCGRQRKVGAAPHRGDPNRPLTTQGKANKDKDKDEDKDPQRNASENPSAAGQKNQNVSCS
jgi:hypothetical protein